MRCWALLTVLRASSAGVGAVDFRSLSLWQYGYLAVSGALAISAMLLPGISGSTLLLILGVYIPLIGAAREVLHLHLQFLPGVCAVAVGIVLGIVFAARLIRRALVRFRCQTVWLILGLMVGSLYAIVMGATTLTVPAPPLSLASFRVMAFLLGAAMLGGLEWMKHVVEGKTPEEASGAEPPSAQNSIKKS